MAKQKVLEKMGSIFKEELWGRIEPKDIGISKFKILDDLFNAIVAEGLIGEACDDCRSHLAEHAESITAAYILGLCGYHTNKIEDTIYVRRLIDVFIQKHKWAVVELLSEKVLEYGENSVALRALAASLERLGRSRDAIPVLENLLKIDRFDAEVAKKLAFAIIDGEREKSVYYMKLSIEGFVKNKNFDEIPALWNKLISISWNDISFFERIERLLIESKQQELAASLLKSLLGKYKDDQNPEQSIELLKKILEYRPDDTNIRRDLIRLFRIKYGEHTQFDQFVKLSKLNNFRVPPKYAIIDFEKNIVFDIGNYAHHNTWGLGKIKEITSDSITIDFNQKVDHKMSIQMALQSLKPIGKDHLYVMQYDEPEIAMNLFKDEFMEFFHLLIKSYGGTISVEDIKKELIPRYVEQKAWAKWWSKVRTIIKKDPHYGVSEKKKDVIHLRDKPITFSDELLNKFTKTESFGEKLDFALEFANNISKEEGAEVAQYFIDYFEDELKGHSATRQILSYFILNDLSTFLEPGKLKLDAIRGRVIDYIKESQELPIISMKISSYDYKKDFINLIEESREDWPEIMAELLYETPVRIHKYIINNLIRSHKYNIINGFIEGTITLAKKYPEIFIWIARNILTKTWDYEWLDYSYERLVITFFRLMNELKKIEIEGNRLKNVTLEILFDNECKVLDEIVKGTGKQLLGKIYDLFINVSYIEPTYGEKFITMIKDRYPDFLELQGQVDIEGEFDIEKLVVSREGFAKMKRELDKMANEEMVTLSKELSKVSELSGDMRENVEYNALLEKQTVLKLSISKLDDEIKKADVLDYNVIDTSAVNVGTKVMLVHEASSDNAAFTILGPWDADFDKKILSYRSPIAKSLLGKRTGEQVKLRIDDEEEKVFVINSIDKYSL